MICYRDMTFCPYYKDCNAQKICERPLTEKVKADAEKWMKNAPIAYFTDRPECWVDMRRKRESLMISGAMWIYTSDLGRQETKKISIMFNVGDVYKHNKYEKLVEETTEFKKYRLKSKWESNRTSTFITVKNDTIVSIWRAK